MDPLAVRVAGHFDAIEHVLPRAFAGCVGSLPDLLAREHMEESLDRGVVMAVAAPTHGANQFPYKPPVGDLTHRCSLELVAENGSAQTGPGVSR